jgi:chorismate mutase
MAQVTSPPVMLRALRGAVTLDADTREEMAAKTQKLVLEMLARNDVHHDDVVSVIFTATPDIRSDFPAASVRAIGFGDVPLMCAREIDVEGALGMVVRVLMHCYTTKPRTDLHHVYLDGARALRDDLPE